MAKYIIDTDILALYQHGHPTVTWNVLRHANDEVGISIVTIEEQVLGWTAATRSSKSISTQLAASGMLTGLVASWAAFPVYTSTVNTIQIADQLTRLRLNVGRYDLRIAAIALGIGATVITRNRRDFRRIRGLLHDDWSI